jgi:SAM-dependent methyltransferase
LNSGVRAALQPPQLTSARRLHRYGSMLIRYHSQTTRKETLNTLSLVAPHLDRGMSVLDVGCGEGYVGEELLERGAREVHGVDIVDIRKLCRASFSLYDGQHLPFPDDRFDLVMLNFVLHHVPDPLKIDLVREALRVARAKVFILEDTPTSFLDRIANQRHGEAYRRRIESPAPFGFLTCGEWRWLFRGMGFEPESRSLPRFARSVFQPYARTAFLLRKAPAGASAGARGVDGEEDLPPGPGAVGPGSRPRDAAHAKPLAADLERRHLGLGISLHPVDLPGGLALVVEER